MKALIIDDEPLARNELTYLLNEIGGFEEINEAENVKETLEALLINQYDIIFLDVNLMDENGIELGAKNSKDERATCDYFCNCTWPIRSTGIWIKCDRLYFETVWSKRIEQAVNKVRATKAKDDNSANAIANDMSANFDQSLPVEIDDKIHMLKQQNIIGIGTHNGITTIHTTNHKYETTEPLNRYEKRLNPLISYVFIVHILLIRNTLKKCNNGLTTLMVILTNGVKMQVGRSFMKDFKASIGLL